MHLFQFFWRLAPAHSNSSRKDLRPLSMLMAQYEEQFPSLEASCSKTDVRRSERFKNQNLVLVAVSVFGLHLYCNLA